MGWNFNYAETPLCCKRLAWKSAIIEIHSALIFFKTFWPNLTNVTCVNSWASFFSSFWWLQQQLWPRGCECQRARRKKQINSVILDRQTAALQRRSADCDLSTHTLARSHYTVEQQRVLRLLHSLDYKMCVYSWEHVMLIWERYWYFVSVMSPLLIARASF